MHAGIKVVVVGHGAAEVQHARLVSIGMLRLGLSGAGYGGFGFFWIRGRRQAGFGAAIGVVKHGVTSTENNVYAVTHGDGFQHFNHFFMGQTQHAGVIDIHQDVS